MEIEDSLIIDEEFLDYDLEFASPIYEDIKRGYFKESKHSKNITRASKKNKVLRNIPRNETHFLSVKKERTKGEHLSDQYARQKENFLKKQIKNAIAAPTSCASSPQRKPIVVPSFTAPKSQYERELQDALKISVADKHASGLSYQMLLDFSSRELTPEDYEMLLLLDSVIEKKTTSTNVMKSLNEFIIDETSVGGDCPICVCSFEIDEKVISLNCSHIFHAGCVTEWLTKHAQTCPLCNTTVSC